VQQRRGHEAPLQLFLKTGDFVILAVVQRNSIMYYSLYTVQWERVKENMLEQDQFVVLAHIHVARAAFYGVIKVKVCPLFLFENDETKPEGTMMR
jgi:hypothetical protein